MPSTPRELRERWGDDGAAWRQLGDRFRLMSASSCAAIIVPKRGVVPTEDDESAIDFLFYEFDFAYHPCNKGVDEGPCGRDRCVWCGANAP